MELVCPHCLSPCWEHLPKKLRLYMYIVICDKCAKESTNMRASNHSNHMGQGHVFLQEIFRTRSVYLLIAMYIRISCVYIRKSLTIWTLRKLQFQDTTTSVQDTLKILHLLSLNFSESPSTLIPKLWQRLSTNQNPNYLTPASNRLCQSSHGCSHYEGGSMLPGHARQEPAIEIALSLSLSISLSLSFSLALGLVKEAPDSEAERLR